MTNEVPSERAGLLNEISASRMADGSVQLRFNQGEPARSGAVAVWRRARGGSGWTGPEWELAGARDAEAAKASALREIDALRRRLGFPTVEAALDARLRLFEQDEEAAAASA